MRHQVKCRLSVTESLTLCSAVQLSGNAAHYIGNVLRLKEGDAVALFNRTDGAVTARITQLAKKTVTLQVETRLQPPEQPIGLTVCFAPIRGGRLETIIEKATELGADVLQPVLTQRSVVDKVNLERAEAIAREAAEQCERTGWPDIRPPVKLLTLLGSWPDSLPLLYGDETGGGVPITEAVKQKSPTQWAVLTGPEGGFTPEELAALKRVPGAIGVGLGPRILRADTSVITLCTATLMAWGDWHLAPRFKDDA